MKKRSIVGTFFSYLFVLLFVAVVVGGVWYFFRPFTATMNNSPIAEVVELSPCKTVTIDLHFPITQRDKSYSVKVFSYAEEDFDFKANGEWHTYGAESLDLTNGFLIEKGEKSFSITCYKSLRGILADVFPNAELTDFPEGLDTTKPLFRLELLSGNVVKEVVFSCPAVAVDTVTLSQSEVIL